ncbi:hypothetical protein ACFSJ3_16925 [Corallincola platygyrae]|uniref:Uncharacterized protein n=1 Tax=Corallincola platygyrae TaxID=1193278 RepID=A0ABW4XS51_9GAMM
MSEIELVDLSHFPEPLRQQMAVVNDPQWRQERQRLWERKYQQGYMESYSRKDYEKIYSLFMFGMLFEKPNWGCFSLKLELFPVFSTSAICYLLGFCTDEELASKLSNKFCYAFAYKLMGREHEKVTYEGCSSEKAALDVFDWFWGEEFQSISIIPCPIGKDRSEVEWNHSVRMMAYYIFSAIHNDTPLREKQKLPWHKRHSFIKSVLRELESEFFNLDGYKTHFDWPQEKEIQSLIHQILVFSYQTATASLPATVTKLNADRQRFIENVFEPLRRSIPELDKTMKSIRPEDVFEQSQVTLHFSLDAAKDNQFYQFARAIFIHEFGEHRIDYFDNENKWMPKHAFCLNIEKLIESYCPEKLTDWRALVDRFPEIEKSKFEALIDGQDRSFVITCETQNPKAVELGMVGIFKSIGAQNLESWYCYTS